MFVFQPEPKDDIEDDRTWTFRHMKAANIPTPHMQVLTPPQDMNCNRNVDERGPGMCVMCIILNTEGGSGSVTWEHFCLLENFEKCFYFC